MRTRLVWTTYASIGALAVNLTTWLAAARWNIDLAAHPARFYATHASVGILRLSLGADVAAYLLLVPFVLHLRAGAVAKAGGLTYCIVGASGAAILAGTWPALLREQHAQLAFSAVTGSVYQGLWHIVATAGLGTWLALAGPTPTTRLIGKAASVAAAAVAFATILGIERVAQAALGCVAVGFVAWVLIATASVSNDEVELEHTGTTR